MIEITRKTLLDSRDALGSLGNLEVHGLLTDEYMNIIDTFETITKILSDESKSFTRKHHALLMEIGERISDNNGLEQYAIEPSKQDEFNDLLTNFLSEIVSIDVEMIPTVIFDGGQPRLSIADRAALKWLLVERGICNS